MVAEKPVKPLTDPASWVHRAEACERESQARAIVFREK
jgi:hypothetical protein